MLQVITTVWTPFTTLYIQSQINQPTLTEGPVLLNKPAIVADLKLVFKHNFNNSFLKYLLIHTNSHKPTQTSCPQTLYTDFPFPAPPPPFSPFLLPQ